MTTLTTTTKKLKILRIKKLLPKCNHKIVVTVIEAPSGLTYCSVSTLAMKVSFLIEIGMDSVWRSVDVVIVVGVGVVVVAVASTAADTDAVADAGPGKQLLISVTSTGVVNFFSLT